MKTPFAAQEAARATKIAQLQEESEPSETVATAYDQEEVHGIQRIFMAHGSLREIKASLA
jgi:hypothetical protein